MLPVVKVTRADKGAVVYIPADRIHRVEAASGGGGAVLFLEGQPHGLCVKESAEDVAGGINQCVEWKETRAVAAQVQIAQQAANAHMAAALRNGN